MSFFKAPKQDSTEFKVKQIFENPPTLETERLYLTRILPEHSWDMHEYACDDEITKYLTWSSHKTPKETERYITLLQKKYKSGVFNDWGLVLKDTGKFIGTCGFTSFDYESNTAEIGYVLAKPYQKKGLATEAALRVMQFGIQQLNLDGFCAKCIQGNDASLRVMQKCGLKLEGIYNNSMFIKGEYKTIIVCRGDAQTVLEIIRQREEKNT